MNSWAAKVHWSILIELWCFTLDQLYPCLSICIASCLEVVAALWGEEAEEVLPAAFWVFKVAYGVQVVEADLLEETFFGRRFVERKKVGAEDKVKGLPLL